MSGAEKREKMVVWEAAISSSLTHPNIVQTYTYSIKPVKESVPVNKQSTHRESHTTLGSAVMIVKCVCVCCHLYACGIDACKFDA